MERTTLTDHAGPVTLNSNVQVSKLHLFWALCYFVWRTERRLGSYMCGCRWYFAIFSQFMVYCPSVASWTHEQCFHEMHPWWFFLFIYSFPKWSWQKSSSLFGRMNNPNSTLQASGISSLKQCFDLSLNISLSVNWPVFVFYEKILSLKIKRLKAFSMPLNIFATTFCLHCFYSCKVLKMPGFQTEQKR